MMHFTFFFFSVSTFKRRASPKFLLFNTSLGILLFRIPLYLLPYFRYLNAKLYLLPTSCIRILPETYLVHVCVDFMCVPRGIVFSGYVLWENPCHKKKKNTN